LFRVSSNASQVTKYSDINWTPSSIELLQNLYQNGLLRAQCLKPNGESYPGKWENFSRFQLLGVWKIFFQNTV